MHKGECAKTRENHECGERNVWRDENLELEMLVGCKLKLGKTQVEIELHLGEHI